MTYGIIENSSGVWKRDIREQCSTFESCGEASFRGWIARCEVRIIQNIENIGLN